MRVFSYVTFFVQLQVSITPVTQLQVQIKPVASSLAPRQQQQQMIQVECREAFNVPISLKLNFECVPRGLVAAVCFHVLLMYGRHRGETSAISVPFPVVIHKFFEPLK